VDASEYDYCDDRQYEVELERLGDLTVDVRVLDAVGDRKSYGREQNDVKTLRAEHYQHLLN